MDVVDIIQRLTATNSRIEKEQIIFDAFMNGHRDFFIGAKLAYDPLISFGIAKVAEIIEDDDEAGNYTFNDFINLTNLLRSRKLTGNAARDAIRAAATMCHVKTWNLFYRRVLLKDLKAGVEEKTINKVLNKLLSSDPSVENFIIPIFGCQLAHDGGKPVHAKKIKGKCLVDVKLDGTRIITILDKENNEVSQFTRNGKINNNFSNITENLKKVIPFLPGSLVLDGEMVARSFQELMTQFNRKENVDTSTARLALFDVIPLNDFRKGICKTVQSDRHSILSGMVGLFQEHCGQSVFVIPKMKFDLGTEIGKAQFDEFNRNAIDNGYEGIMVKNPNGIYVNKRSADWIKIKPFIEVTLEIISVEEGKEEGKYTGVLGAFVCSGEDDGDKISVNVGSGFSDEQRIDFWNRREELIGMMVEVRADALTLEQGSDIYSLRFPRFKGFRGTIKGEKL